MTDDSESPDAIWRHDPSPDPTKKDWARSSDPGPMNGLGHHLVILPGDDAGTVDAHFGDLYWENVHPLDLADYLDKVAAAATKMAIIARTHAGLYRFKGDDPDAYDAWFKGETGTD